MKKHNTMVNLTYAFAIFFYVDLLAVTLYYTSTEIYENYKIKQEAAQILEFPDLASL